MTSRTIDIDRLFTRDIFFKDASNRPISANKVILTRGDGGIYFSNLPDGGNNSTPTAFNNFRAGENLQFAASNASNTLWFEAGAGIQFYSTIDVTQPKFWIAATAPEQIRVTGNGTGVVNFSTLVDELVGGRTLYFAGTGDTTVNVSDTTVLFGSAYNSTYSSLVELQSTTLDLYLLESSIVSSLNQTLSTVNFFLLSTSVSSFYSTLLSVQSQTDELSSFVWSTFTKDANNNRNILTINQISSSHVQASTLQAGTNIISDKAGVPLSDPDCVPYTQNGYTQYTYSTSTNLFTIQDNNTAVKFAIEKDAQYGTSTFVNSTFEKVVLQSQVGMQTQLSTGSTFVPILQQLEIRETETTLGMPPSIIDYRVVNIANLDEICSPNGLTIHAPVVSISTLNVSSITGVAGIGGGMSTFSVLYAGEIRPSTVGGTTFIDNATLSTIVGNVASIADLRVSSINGIIPFPSTFSTAFFSTSQTTNATISTLNVSTINGIQPFFNPQLSSFSTIFISTMYDNQAFINDLRVSSINGFAPFISTFSTLQTSTITASVVSTTQLIADVIQARLINVSITSTTLISTSIVQANTLSSIFTNTGVLTATNGSVTALNVSSINGREPFISSYETLFASTFNNMLANISDLRVSSINGIIPFPSTFSTAFFSTSQTIDATISTLNVSTINGIQPFFNPQLSSFSTIFISTMYDNQAFINDLRVSSINGFEPFISSYSSLTTSSITANVMSTGQLIADTIQARLINVTITSTTLISTSIVQANTLSSIFTNTGVLTATNGAVTALNVSSINGREPFVSSYETLFASTFNNMLANISDLRVSSINGIIPFPSTFSTAFFSTSQTIDATISTLNVSTINGIQPFFNPQLSSFSTIYISTMYDNQGFINDLHVSSINGFAPFISSYSSLTTSSIAAEVMSTGQLIADTIQARLINVTITSTTLISTSIVQATTLSSIFTNTGALTATTGEVTALNVSSINGREPFISSYEILFASTFNNMIANISDLHVSSINGVVPFPSSFSTAYFSTSQTDQSFVTDLNVSSINGREPFISSYEVLFASTFNNMLANISDLRVSSINGIIPFPSTFSTAFFSTSQTIDATISTLNVSTINGIQPFFNPQLSTFSTIYISTMYSGQGFVGDFNVSSINGFAPFISSFSSLTTSSIAAEVMSTGQLIADVIQARLINVTITSTTLISTSIVQATTLSSIFTNTGALTATMGDVTAINVSSINGREPFISSYEILFASTFNNMIANISDLHVSSINGVVPFPSSFSTAFFSTSQTDQSYVTELFVSSINGHEPVVSSYEILFASTFYNMIANISDLHVSSINGIVPFPSTFSTAYVSSLMSDSISTGTVIANSIYAQYIDVQFISTTVLSSFEITADIVSTSQLYANSAVITDLYISTINGLPYLASSFSTLLVSTATMDVADITDLTVSSINGINPFFQETISTFSTLYWSTAQGLDASISSVRLSTVMGTELPIFTFDMENRRVGVNLGATQQPRCALDINGIAYASNFVTMSDRRHKKNISTLDVDLDTLPRGYRFQWRKDDAWDIGCMADEVEAFAPEAVFLTNTGDKTVSYHKLVPACLNMIRKLTERMNDLERKLEMYHDL